MRRSVIVTPAVLLIALLTAQPTLGTSLPPVKYNKWRQDQVVPFMWKADAKPPAWLRPAVLAGVEDSATSRGSRAAVFELAESANSWVGYMEDVCAEAAIGCAWNNAPNSFSLRFRPQGWVFDWGVLRWCQFYETPPNGCLDAELVTLHELGHVQSLGHVEETPDPDDWLDSVMHSVTRSKPKVGWNMHEFGRCDVGALQTAYGPLTSATPISTCLSLRTETTLTPSSMTVPYRGSVRFTATLATDDDVAYPRLRSQPLSQRVVTLERRLPGGTWYAIATLLPTLVAGEYSTTLSVISTYEWRASFSAAAEGLQASITAPVRVTVGECTSGCPQRGGVL